MMKWSKTHGKWLRGDEFYNPSEEEVIEWFLEGISRGRSESSMYFDGMGMSLSKVRGLLKGKYISRYEESCRAGLEIFQEKYMDLYFQVTEAGGEVSKDLVLKLEVARKALDMFKDKLGFKDKVVTLEYKSSFPSDFWSYNLNLVLGDDGLGVLQRKSEGGSVEDIDLKGMVNADKD